MIIYTTSQFYNVINFGLQALLNWEQFWMNLKVIWRLVPCTASATWPADYIIQVSWNVEILICCHGNVTLNSHATDQCSSSWLKNIQKKHIKKFFATKMTSDATHSPPHHLGKCYASFYENTATVEREWMLSPMHEKYRQNHCLNCSII